MTTCSRLILVMFSSLEVSSFVSKFSVATKKCFSFFTRCLLSSKINLFFLLEKRIFLLFLGLYILNKSSFPLISEMFSIEFFSSYVTFSSSLINLLEEILNKYEMDHPPPPIFSGGKQLFLTTTVIVHL